MSKQSWFPYIVHTVKLLRRKEAGSHLRCSGSVASDDFSVRQLLTSCQFSCYSTNSITLKKCIALGNSLWVDHGLIDGRQRRHKT